MAIGLLGRKVGMTRIYGEDGGSTPVTVLEIAANRVSQVKTVETDGYNAIQMGFEKVNQLIEKDTIELLPLAFMRGRSLNDSFIILDEAQNTTVEQMKMFLTRLGFSSTAVITGDITQIDLPRVKLSGLKQVMGMLQSTPGISFTFFNSGDVVRHPVVQKIIEAYALYDTKHNNAKGSTGEY